MTDLKRSAIAAALTFTLVSGLAACGTKDDAKPAEAATAATESSSERQSDEEAKDENVSGSGKESASVKPSASPSPTGPYKPATPKRPAQNVPVPGPLPEVAKEESKAGQIAFVEHWVKEVNYAMESRQPTRLFQEMNGAKCKYCKKIKTSADNLRKTKTWVVGGKIRLEHLRPEPRQSSDAEYRVTTHASNDKILVYTKNSTKPVQTVPATKQPNGFVALEWREDKWVVKGFYNYAD